LRNFLKLKLSTIEERVKEEQQYFDNSSNIEKHFEENEVGVSQRPTTLLQSEEQTVKDF